MHLGVRHLSDMSTCTFITWLGGDLSRGSSAPVPVIAGVSPSVSMDGFVKGQQGMNRPVSSVNLGGRTCPVKLWLCEELRLMCAVDDNVFSCSILLLSVCSRI